MNTTIWVALITGIFASVPSLIKGWQDLKLKKIEIYENDKRQAIIDFSDAVSYCFGANGYLSGEEIIKYQQSVNKLLLYFPNIDLEIIDKLNKAIYDKNLDSKQDIIRPLIIELSKSIPEI